MSGPILLLSQQFTSASLTTLGLIVSAQTQKIAEIVNYVGTILFSTKQEFFYYQDSKSSHKAFLDGTPQHCILTTYVAPQHGFVDLHCPGSNNPVLETIGFYPHGDEASIISNSVMGYFRGQNYNLLGYISYDFGYKLRCLNSLNCAKAEFIISKEQANNALKFIEERIIDCKNEDKNRCGYNLIDKNCVTFVTQVTKAAGIKENWMQKLKTKEKDTNPLFSLDFKAWAYIYLSTDREIKLSERLF